MRKQFVIILHIHKDRIKLYASSCFQWIDSGVTEIVANN